MSFTLLQSFLLALQDKAADAAQAAPAAAQKPAPPPDFGSQQIFIIIGLFLFVFYFMMWRPQSKEKKAREAMMKTIKKGDRILLSCGLIAHVAVLTEQEVVVKVDDKIRMRFQRHAIQTVLGGEEAAPAEAEADAK